MTVIGLVHAALASWVVMGAAQEPPRRLWPMLLAGLLLWPLMDLLLLIFVCYGWIQGRRSAP